MTDDWKHWIDEPETEKPGNPVVLLVGSMALFGLGTVFAMTGTPWIGATTAFIGGFFGGVTIERWGTL